MPRFSIITIAKKEKELERLRNALERQEFRDFELITSTKGTIPEAWNDAISRAKGDFLVFIESDAIPLNDHWLQDIAKVAVKGTIIKGLEINPTDLDLSNMVCDRTVFDRGGFDESFQVCEDVELFARLRRMGISIEHHAGFPVIHSPSQTWEKTMSRGLKQGLFLMKIVYLHGRNNVDDINTRNIRSNYINPVSNRIRIIVENSLVLLGLVVGAVCYLPVLLRRKLENKG